MPIEQNAGERKAVRRLVRHLTKHAFTVTHVDDGSERIPVRTIEDIIEHVFSVDDSNIIVASETDLDGTHTRRTHSIYIVLGNASDGSEIVCDHGYTESDPDGFSKCMDAFMDDTQA